MELQKLLQEIEQEGKLYNENIDQMMNFVNSVCDFIVKCVGDKDDIKIKVRLKTSTGKEFTYKIGIREFKLERVDWRCVYLDNDSGEYALFIKGQPGKLYDYWYRVANVNEFKMFVENLDRILISFTEELKNENSELENMIKKLEKAVEALS